MIFNAILPIFILLVLGNVARRSGFLNEVFWTQAEKGTYYVLFPVLIITKLAQGDFDWSAESRLVFAALLILLSAASLCLVVQFFIRLQPGDFTSFFQGGTRFNNYLGFALVATLPEPGLTLAALLMGVMVPVVNVFCVIAYALCADKTLSVRNVVITVFKNPLVVACLLGLLLNTMDASPPPVITDVLSKLGLMALPMGVLAVGAGLRLQALRGAGLALTWSALLKLIVLPVLAYVLAWLLGLSTLATTVLVIYSGLPTSTSAYILARQMRGNAELMAGIITGQTLLSLITLPWFLLSLQA